MFGVKAEYSNDFFEKPTFSCLRIRHEVFTPSYLKGAHLLLSR